MMSDDQSEPCILIEGPRWADAEFYGRWLVAAGRANRFWLKALKNAIFEKQVNRLTIAFIPDFGIGATVMISRLEKNLASFTIHLNVSCYILANIDV
jgi:hypothetical protein